MRLFLAISVSATTLFSGPGAISAATLSAAVTTNVLNNPSGGGYLTATDTETSSDAGTDSVVDAAAIGEGRDLFTNQLLNAASSSASVNYLSGELKAKVEADASGTFSGRISGGRAEARLRDEISFFIAPTAISSDVTFQWTVERTILGNTGTLGTSTDNVKLSSFVQIRDGFSSFGNTLVDSRETFTTSGTDVLQWSIDVSNLPNSLLRLELGLRADADTYCDTGPFGGECSLDVLADASNTGFLNIITPTGVTFAGTDRGFLSQARNPNGPAIVPLPGAFGLTLGGLLCLGFARARRGSAERPAGS